MSVIKCKMCGGTVDFTPGETVGVCDFCGTKQTLPKANDEVITNLFNRANNLRLKCEFDKAEQIYEKIVQQDDSEAEAHWGIILCKYGIEYVEDPKTFERVPTCHRTRFESIRTDADYEAAIDYSDMLQQSIYEKEAREIDKLQKDILAIVKNEEPFDVFICYKETDDNGKRTVDSTLANDIYHQLTQNGLRVFYAAITLEDKLGQEYEPYIFAALNSAKVMLVIGTKPEYFTTVWVKNEWSRFMNLMKTDRSKILIPCYRDMDAYDLPEEFAHLQAQDMSRIGFIQDIIRGVNKVVQKEEKAQITTTDTSAVAGPNANALLKRGFMSLEDNDWSDAKDFFNQVLNIDAEYGDAYLGLFMANHKIESKSVLGKKLAEAVYDYNLEKDKNYQRALKYSDEDQTIYLENLIKEHINHLAHNREVLRASREERNRRTYNIYTGSNFTIGLQSDGSVVAVGRNDRNQCNVSDWNGIKDISVAAEHVLGLREDGTAVATGHSGGFPSDSSPWSEIIAIAQGWSHAIGLRSDGTVVAAGNNDKGQCKVEDWKDIVGITAGADYTLGLRSDGTVVATGNNSKGQCNVSEWKNIIDITAGFGYSLGLVADGTVVATGANNAGQCDVSDWTNIIATVPCYEYSLGLKSDGTVVAAGNNDKGQCNVSDWTDVIALAAGSSFTIGLRSDGTVVATGSNKKGQCNISNWTDIVAIAAKAFHTIGLRSDGTVVATGWNDGGQCNVSGWKLLITEEDKNNWYNTGLQLIEISTVDSLNKALSLFDRLKDYKNSKELADHSRARIQQLNEEEKRKDIVLLIEKLERERDSLLIELNDLHGLFTGKRRKEIETRLAEIERSILIHSK